MKILDALSNKVYDSIDQWESDLRSEYFKNVEEEFSEYKKKCHAEWMNEFWREDITWGEEQECREYLQSRLDELIERAAKSSRSLDELELEECENWARQKHYRAYTDKDEERFLANMEEDRRANLELEEELFADFLEDRRGSIELIE